MFLAPRASAITEPLSPCRHKLYPPRSEWMISSTVTFARSVCGSRSASVTSSSMIEPPSLERVVFRIEYFGSVSDESWAKDRVRARLRSACLNAFHSKTTFRENTIYEIRMMRARTRVHCIDFQCRRRFRSLGGLGTISRLRSGILSGLPVSLALSRGSLWLPC
jgi:hypothetical protein